MAQPNGEKSRLGSACARSSHCKYGSFFELQRRCFRPTAARPTKPRPSMPRVAGTGTPGLMPPVVGAASRLKNAVAPGAIPPVKFTLPELEFVTVNVTPLGP